nr:hypothetical protein Hi04_10k_c2835_00025 [uncultured bacterium]
MSRRHICAAVVASAALLAGCGTGLHARTYQEIGREDGAATNLGGSSGVAIRNVHVEPATDGGNLASGTTAFVTGGLINNGTSDEALVGASSTAASSVLLLVDGSPVNQVTLPALGTAPTTWSLALTDLSTTLTPASYVTVTLDFRRAGQVTLQVPVQPGDTGLQDRTPDQNPHTVA